MFESGHRVVKYFDQVGFFGDMDVTGVLSIAWIKFGLDVSPVEIGGWLAQDFKTAGHTSSESKGN